MSTKKVKSKTIRKRVDQLKDRVRNFNEEAFHLSDNFVEASLTTGGKWQKLMAKAMKEGTILFGKQQELALDTLEELKTQYISGNTRFRKLLGLGTKKATKRTKKEEVVDLKIDELLEEKPRAKKERASSKSDVAKDDLKIIEGIGPKIEVLINEAGITTFARLAATDVEDLKTILENAGPRFKVHNPTTWKQQAKLAMAGKLPKDHK